MKKRVVDRVDAETLDEIAKELSLEYWKEYKKITKKTILKGWFFFIY